jgi:YD repeat-containing protein
MKILLVLAVVLLATAASAQQNAFYDARGNVIGRSATDSSGTTTIYDAAGRKVGQATKRTSR